MGTFRWDERYQVAQFEYDRSFVGRRIEPSPLMMPVREGRVYSFLGLNRETVKSKFIFPVFRKKEFPHFSEV